MIERVSAVLKSPVVPRIAITVINETITGVLPGVAVYSKTGSIPQALCIGLTGKLFTDVFGSCLKKSGDIKTISDLNAYDGQLMNKFYKWAGSTRVGTIVKKIFVNIK